MSACSRTSARPPPRRCRNSSRLTSCGRGGWSCARGWHRRDRPAMSDLDFDLEIRSSGGRDYEVAVLQSPAGEAQATMHFPFDELQLRVRLQSLEIALLRSGGNRRRLDSPDEQTVQDFGRDLFDALISGEVRSRFDVSLAEADRQGQPLRIRLRFESPALAALPWEFLFDARTGEYLVLSTSTPLVRYIELPDVIEPLAVEPP